VRVTVCGGCGTTGPDADRRPTRRFPLRHLREETIWTFQAERTETRDLSIWLGNPVSSAPCGYDQLPGSAHRSFINMNI